MLLGLLLATPAQAASRNLMVQSSQVQQQKRVALVIGNSAYHGAAELRNPVNDAKAMSDALNGLGFQVIEVTNATQKEMNHAIAEFGQKLNADTAALFFYAGHGLQVKGKNYIVPVDAQISGEAAVRAETVDMDTVMDQLNVSSLSIVILDACRNNPFERSFRKLGGGGLAQMDAPKGSFIAYATAPGKTASDGDGKNGLFTQELLKQINMQGLSLEDVFKRVRTNVLKATDEAQMPWDSSSMTGSFYFKPGKGAPVASLEPVAEPVGGGVSLDDIKKQQESRAKWDKWQQEMKADFDKIVAMNAAPDLQLTAWERFLASYMEENPFSVEDEQLRTLAQTNKQNAQKRLQKQKSESGITVDKVFRDCPDCPEMVAIPSGSFYMGSNGEFSDMERPAHKVTFMHSFAIGKYEITQGEWQAIMGNNPSGFVSCGKDCPVDKVSWDDAQVFIEKLNQKTDKQYRLPSESEWDYASGGGYRSTFTYDKSKEIYKQDDSQSVLKPVGSDQPNKYGLFDMLGSVWEWMEDCRNDDYKGAPINGGAWESGDCSQRVLRGGTRVTGWSNISGDFVSGGYVTHYDKNRMFSETRGAGSLYGFRLAITIPAEAAQLATKSATQHSHTKKRTVLRPPQDK